MSEQRQRLGECKAVGDWVDVTRYLHSTMPEKDGFMPMYCLLDGYTKPATKCVFKLARDKVGRTATRVS